jgi:predicted  nucleic acid-binding Zn-ribbon protein
MEEDGGQVFMDLNTRIRELEERQRLLKDRTFLIGRGVVDIKEKASLELRELRKAVTILQQENVQLKETLQLMSEKLNNTSNKEELQMVMRQLNLLRTTKNGNN